MSDLPKIAVVGRPNVGKSTLFNRMTGKWRSIVEDLPGITRDRLYAECEIFGHRFVLIDTGGLNLAPRTKIEKKTSVQAEKGIEEADCVVFVMDGREGVTPWDRDWAEKIRKLRKPKIFVVNKIDGQAQEDRLGDFAELGLKPLVPVSAEKQRNFSGLSEAILAAFHLEREEPRSETQESDANFDVPEEGAEGSALSEEEAAAEAPVRVKEPDPRLKIAIIGRPNVGKSTLLNAILDEERSIVDDVPGTTRDPIHTDVEREGRQYRFVDTAGIRKRAKTVERVEKFSVMGSLGAIDAADLVLLLVDGAVGPTEQDAHVAGYAFEKRKAIVVVINKWDEGTEKFTREQFKEKLELKMNYLAHCPLIFISAKTGKNLHRVFEAIETVRDQFDKRVKTAELNRLFAYVIDHHPLPTFRGRDIRMYYATQIATRPPLFAVFCNEPAHVHFTYKRYLINALREAFGLKNVPVGLLFKKR